MQILPRIAVALLLVLPTSAWAVIEVDAGPDVTLECESDDGTEYTLNGSVPDLDDLEFEWSTAPEVDLEHADTLTPSGEFPLGDTVATLSAETPTDSGSDDATITVEDTTPPVVNAKADPFYLWPPNHSMHEIKVRLRIRDGCTDDDDFDVELISATSNEPDNGTGDGNTDDDIQDADIGEDDRRVMLRAERKGNGNGRVYTLTYRVTDESGNSTEAEAKVYVPHDASDLKDLLDSMGEGHDKLEPICPRPRDAAEEFLDVLPSPRNFATARACQAGCKAWGRGCQGIARGAGQCVRAELRSLMTLRRLMCRERDDRSSVRACQNDLRDEQRSRQSDQKQEDARGKGICLEEATRCSLRCDDYFGIEEFVE